MKKLIVAIPARNEEKNIRPSLLLLSSYLKANMSDYDWKIVISDNGSTDQTKAFVMRAMATDPHIHYLFTKEAGKGNAIRVAWKQYDADIFCFMDADLSTDIRDLRTLIHEVAGGTDIACGSRHLAQSKTHRSRMRKLISRINNLLIRVLLGSKLKDTPCGFKAVNAKVVKTLLDDVKNNTWFFDTELLIRAERAGYSIKEIPVHWSDVRDKVRKSNVDIVHVCIEYLGNIFQLRRNLQKHVSSFHDTTRG